MGMKEDKKLQALCDSARDKKTTKPIHYYTERLVIENFQNHL